MNIKYLHACFFFFFSLLMGYEIWKTSYNCLLIFCQKAFKVKDMTPSIKVNKNSIKINFRNFYVSDAKTEKNILFICTYIHIHTHRVNAEQSSILKWDLESYFIFLCDNILYHFDIWKRLLNFIISLFHELLSLLFIDSMMHCFTQISTKNSFLLLFT